MTDKEQIISYVRKEQECEELKKEIDKIYEDIKLSPLCYKCSEEGCLRKEIDQLKQECEELKIKLIQKDEVNMFFNTPIEGWDNDPCKICESKNNYEQLKEDYAELEHRHNEAFQDFDQLKQECENLKSEERYLKQCCEKAGKELAKHSFEYDGKEKNLVVQAMELNEKYEVLRLENEEGYEIFAELKHECKEQKDKIKKLRKNLALEIESTDRYCKALEEIENFMNYEFSGQNEWVKTSILDIINKAKGEGNE